MLFQVALCKLLSPLCPTGYSFLCLRFLGALFHLYVVLQSRKVLSRLRFANLNLIVASRFLAS